CTEMFLVRSQQKLADDERQLLELVLKAGQRMSAMISDLLNYVRTLPEEMPLTNVLAAEVIEWATNNLHLAIQTGDAEISYDRNALPVVRGNKIALVQLFQNLLSNAIKFRSAEPPKIRISAERRDNRWFFSVRDNGIGIAPDYHKRIFAIFQRLHTQQYPGTG